MKINNKGMTLVELLVTFSLLLIIVVGLYNLILEVKFKVDDKQIAKDVNEFSSLINNEIHYNLLKDKPFGIAIKDSASSNWECINSTCVFSENKMTYKYDNQDIQITEHNNVCKNIFPCAIYFYEYEENSTKKSSYKVIALGNSNGGTNGTVPDSFKDTEGKLKENGILYGPKGSTIYEPVPNNEFVEIRDKDQEIIGEDGKATTIYGNKPYIKVENDMLIINYGLYIIDDDTNYGFKIVYPFS